MGVMDPRIAQAMSTPEGRQALSQWFAGASGRRRDDEAFAAPSTPMGNYIPPGYSGGYEWETGNDGKVTPYGAYGFHKTISNDAHETMLRALSTVEGSIALKQWFQGAKDVAAETAANERAIRQLAQDNPKLKPLLKDRKARKAFAEWMTAVAARDRLGLTGEGAGRGGLYGAGGADNSASFADRFAAEAGGGAYGAGRPFGSGLDGASDYRMAQGGIGFDDAAGRYVDARSWQLPAASGSASRRPEVRPSRPGSRY